MCVIHYSCCANKSFLAGEHQAQSSLQSRITSLGSGNASTELNNQKTKKQHNNYGQQTTPQRNVDQTYDNNDKNLHNIRTEKQMVPPIMNEENYEEPPQYWIPAPPKENPGLRGNTFFRKGLEGYQYAKVPTAHATLPENFDERLNHFGNHSHQVNVSSDEYGGFETLRYRNDFHLNQRFDKSNQHNFDTETNSLSTNVDKSETTKTTENHSTEREPKKFEKKSIGGMVVRDYQPKLKSGPPKFVPRQTLNLIKKKEKQVTTAPVVDDEVNKELKKNTFKLTKIQGPVTGEGTVAKEITEQCKEDNSVENTRSEIRKRISAVCTC